MGHAEASLIFNQFFDVLILCFSSFFGRQKEAKKATSWSQGHTKGFPGRHEGDMATLISLGRL